jgi:hypothetical protein
MTTPSYTLQWMRERKKQLEKEILEKKNAEKAKVEN